MTIYAEVKHDVGQEVWAAFPLLKQTLALIRIAHDGQTYNSLPYWHHPVRVMLRFGWANVLASDIYAALLHDVLEDTSITVSDLRTFGYDNDCINLVETVTRDKDEDSYKDFIGKVMATGNPRAWRLKLADLNENLNNVRFLPPEKKTIAIRYGKSIRDLESCFTGRYSDHDKFPVISGELNHSEVKRWIGEQPQFV